mmetsp:Transcript_34360/g.86244  ORF Transcript_34360/g.86244 Transcript_34360/m.86244 type:complete len:201 (+) Transcript_34360:939-1541(+)
MCRCTSGCAASLRFWRVIWSMPQACVLNVLLTLRASPATPAVARLLLGVCSAMWSLAVMLVRVTAGDVERPDPSSALPLRTRTSSRCSPPPRRPLRGRHPHHCCVHSPSRHRAPHSFASALISSWTTVVRHWRHCTSALLRRLSMWIVRRCVPRWPTSSSPCVTHRYVAPVPSSVGRSPSSCSCSTTGCSPRVFCIWCSL